MSRSLYRKEEDEIIKKALYPKVLSSVSAAKRRTEYRLLGTWLSLSFFFSPVTFMLLSTLHERLIESSTFEYISMFVNDAEARSLYSKEILYAVYDTIPVAGALLSLVSLVLVTLFYIKVIKIFVNTFFFKSKVY